MGQTTDSEELIEEIDEVNEVNDIEESGEAEEADEAADMEDTDEDDETDIDDDDPEDSEEDGIGLNLFTVLVLFFAAAIATAYFMCTVKTVHVSGNHLYTSKEIAEQVISDDSQLMHNTIFLAALYLTPMAPEIPFEESVKVSIESYDTIMITVKDMDIAGFIPYGGKNLYFSADGIVLEHSPLIVKTATFVTGIPISSAEKGMKMQAENQTGLDLVLEALQILHKYEIKAESVVLGKTGNVTIYLDKVKVQLGRSDFELKIAKIAQIMPYLEGRSGTINMTNYSSADENIILK